MSSLAESSRASRGLAVSKEFRESGLGLQFVLSGEVLCQCFGTSVFLGAEQVSTRPVAVKVVQKPQYEGEEAEAELQRSLEELRVHATVPPHPNILQLLAAEETPSAFVLVTPFVPDGTLWDLMRYGQTYCEREVRNCAAQILAALRHLHETCSLVHGDLKPQNLLLERVLGQHTLKLCDFGLARYVEKSNGSVTFTGLHGTAGWFAPEQLLELDFGFGVDLFACGLIVFRMLSGYAPFEPAAACLHDAVELDERYWFHVSDSCHSFVLQLLAFDPMARGTAHAVSEHPWLLGPPPLEPTTDKLTSVSALGGVPVNDVHFGLPARSVPEISRAQEIESPELQEQCLNKAVLDDGLRPQVVPCH